jgi:hypothetical protein
VPTSIRAAALIPSAWAIRINVVTVGDFVPRSISEIIEAEMPLRVANSRKLKPAQCCEVPAGCLHTEQVGPEGVAFVSGRRRNGGALTREAFESDLCREGFEVINGGQKPNFAEELHAHGDFDVRIMVLSGEITVTRDGGSVTFHAGDHCEIPGDCQHSTKVGPEGVAYIVGKVNRPSSIN